MSINGQGFVASLQQLFIDDLINMRYVIHLRNPIQFRFSDCNCLQLLSALVLALLFHFARPNDLSCLIILNVMFHAIALLVILLFVHSIICHFVRDTV